MTLEGMGANLGPETHREDIVDQAEELVAQMGGTEDAVAALEERLQQNPNDAEALRQITLINNRTADILKRAEELRNEKTLH